MVISCHACSMNQLSTAEQPSFYFYINVLQDPVKGGLQVSEWKENYSENLKVLRWFFRLPPAFCQVISIIDECHFILWSVEGHSETKVSHASTREKTLGPAQTWACQSRVQWTFGITIHCTYPSYFLLIDFYLCTWIASHLFTGTNRLPILFKVMRGREILVW